MTVEFGQVEYAMTSCGPTFCIAAMSMPHIIVYETERRHWKRDNNCGMSEYVFVGGNMSVCNDVTSSRRARVREGR
jgi:hypothetical protein